jgi:hydroxyacylglutathione hydrolase
MKIYKLVFNPIEVNTYILADDSGKAAIIDCGCYDSREFESFVRFIEDKHLDPVLLLNTHSHLDHIFGNKFVFGKYGLKTCSNELDEYNRTDATKHALLFGLSMDEPPEPKAFIKDNEIVSFGSEKLKALLIPGHTTGSLAFYSESEGCLFTGDALFAGSIGRSDLKGGNHETLLKSIKSKLFVLPPATVVYPGHGKETTIEAEMKTNPFFS